MIFLMLRMCDCAKELLPMIVKLAGLGVGKAMGVLAETH